MIKFEFIDFSPTEQACILICIEFVRAIVSLLIVVILTVFIIETIFRCEGFHGDTGLKQGTVDAELT